MAVMVTRRQIDSGGSPPRAAPPRPPVKSPPPKAPVKAPAPRPAPVAVKAPQPGGTKGTPAPAKAVTGGGGTSPVATKGTQPSPPGTKAVIAVAKASPNPAKAAKVLYADVKAKDRKDKYPMAQSQSYKVLSKPNSGNSGGVKGDIKSKTRLGKDSKQDINSNFQSDSCLALFHRANEYLAQLNLTDFYRVYAEFLTCLGTPATPTPTPTLTPTPSPTPTPNPTVTIYFGGFGYAEAEEDNPDRYANALEFTQDQAPFWSALAGNGNIFPYEGSKVNQANAALSRGYLGLNVRVIGYSGGADAAVLFASQFTQQGGTVTDLAILGGTMTAQDTRLREEWPAILQSLQESGTDIYVLDDSAGDDPVWTSYDGTQFGPGSYINDPSGEPHIDFNFGVEGSGVNNDPRIMERILTWLDSN